MAGAVAAWAQTSRRTDVNSAQTSAKEIIGASPYIEIANEPPPSLAQGLVWIQWRVENLRVVPVFGKGAVSGSPRVGHLHVHVDDLGWWWADASGLNTIVIAGSSEGPHKVRLDS